MSDRLKGFHTAHRREPTSWEVFVEQVREAERKRKKSGDPNAVPPPPKIMKWPPPEERQCDFRGKSLNGARCKKWSMKGATRCESHGGYRQAPSNPATIRRLLAGDIDAVSREKAIRAQHRGRPEVQEMRQTLRAMGIPTQPSDVEEALQAQAQDAAGRAWRKWIKKKKAETMAMRRQTYKARAKSDISEQKQRLKGEEGNGK